MYTPLHPRFRDRCQYCCIFFTVKKAKIPFIGGVYTPPHPPACAAPVYMGVTNLTDTQFWYSPIVRRKPTIVRTI